MARRVDRRPRHGGPPGLLRDIFFAAVSCLSARSRRFGGRNRRRSRSDRRHGDGEICRLGAGPHRHVHAHLHRCGQRLSDRTVGSPRVVAAARSRKNRMNLGVGGNEPAERAGRIVCFGEVLLRLAATPGEMLLQTPTLRVAVGGAEANVAVALARAGVPAALLTILPDNALGAAARDELRRHGVETSRVRFLPGRMGLYFLTPGAALRPADIVYDRAGSTFALAQPDLIDWEAELDGASRLHLSGVTPALGANAAAAAVRAARAATRLGVPMSFDGNYRAKLWAATDGHAPTLLRALLAEAETAFVDHRV